MITASSLRKGMVVRIEGLLFQVLSSELHMGGGKMGSLEHLRLRNLATGAVLERRFRPDERVEPVEVETRRLEYSYRDGEFVVFLDSMTFEQVVLHEGMLADRLAWLTEELQVTGQFFEGNPVAIQFPDYLDLKVVTAPPGLHEADSTTPKGVTLENGMELLTPQFIREGDVVRVNLETGKYMERV